MGTFNNKISPMGYNLGGEPKNDNPFFDFNGSGGGGGGTVEIPDDIVSANLELNIGAVQTGGEVGSANFIKQVDTTTSPYKLKYFLNLVFPEGGGGSILTGARVRAIPIANNTWMEFFQNIRDYISKNVIGGITGVFNLQGSMVFVASNVSSWISFYAGSAVENNGSKIDPTFAYRAEYVTSDSNWVTGSDSYASFAHQNAGLPNSDVIRFNDEAARISILWEPKEDEQIAGIDRKVTTTIYIKYEDENGSSNSHEEVRIQFEMLYDSSAKIYYLAPDIGQDVNLGTLGIYDCKTPYISENNYSGNSYRFVGTQIQHVMLNDSVATGIPDRHGAAINLFGKLTALANINKGIYYIEEGNN